MSDHAGAGSRELIALCERFGAHNYHPLPVVLARGEGIWVWDVEGRKYLDFLSAYSAVNQGHRHPRIVAALREQVERITLTSRAFHNDKLGPFLERVCRVCGMEKALPMNTGAEAVETAIKLARKWGYEVKGVPEGAAEIIVCAGNFHGRTVTIVGFSSEAQYRRGFGPFTPGFRIVPYGDLEAIRAAVTEHTVAVLVEPIQGEGGIIIPPEGYLRGLRELCSANRVLLMLDEIQTGLCRTGEWFACRHEGIEPDVYILGKALGGGVVAVSAVVSSSAIMDVFKPGDHGSTFGGNPLACAVGIASLQVLEEEALAENAREMGEYFMDRLRSLESRHIAEVRGKGLLIGVEIAPASGVARPFCEKLMELGLLCKETHERVVRFAPPLVINREEIDWAMERIRQVFVG
jgi:ornithine--oxo-acid transaminase